MKAVSVNPAWKTWDKEYLSVFIDNDDRVWSHYIISENGDAERIFFGDFVDGGGSNDPNSKPLELVFFRLESANFASLTADEAREFAQAILDIVGKK